MEWNKTHRFIVFSSLIFIENHGLAGHANYSNDVQLAVKIGSQKLLQPFHKNAYSAGETLSMCHHDPGG